MSSAQERAADGPSRGACLDCKRRYGDEYGFPDLIVSNDAWEIINPGSDGAGLLCPSCICARAHAAGLAGGVARFASGPFADRDLLVDDDTAGVESLDSTAHRPPDSPHTARNTLNTPTS